MARDCHQHDARGPRARWLLCGHLDRRLQDHRTTAATQRYLYSAFATTLVVAADAVHYGFARSEAYAETRVAGVFSRLLAPAANP